MSDAPRWLDADAVADYISVRSDALRRLEKAGKLPVPSYHLGERSPRWDRADLDRLFAGAAASRNIRGAVSDAVAEILAKGRAGRAKNHGKRGGA